MNKTEAIRRVDMNLNDYNSTDIDASGVKMLIQEIYDDFEARTCDKCKSWHREQITFGTCEANIDQCDITDLSEYVTKNSFGCNKFERINK